MQKTMFVLDSSYKKNQVPWNRDIQFIKKGFGSGSCHGKIYWNQRKGQKS